MKTKFKDTLTIEEGGIRGLLRFIEAIREAEAKGYEIDPQQRDMYIPKEVHSGFYRVVMFMKEDVVKSTLDGMPEEELLDLIENTTKKADQLELADRLNIEIPEDVKHPTAIKAYIKKSVKGEL